WRKQKRNIFIIVKPAQVNIAATSAADSSGGLFFTRDPNLIQPFAAHSPGGQHLATGWYVWTDSTRWIRLANQPLNTRGWVLQQRLLSTRTIHFTRSEIIWQCLEDLSSESIQDRLPNNKYRIPVTQIGDYTDIKSSIAEAQVSGLTTDTLHKIYTGWNRVLAQYTLCRLTMDSDKLVAISGIVDYLERITGDECLAGLWRSQMPKALLWSVFWDAENESPCPEWRAPSWSWTSHNMPIR
ncbi:hypothetical protein V8F06_014321, partial [Rhypophila decipiens]